MALGRRVEAWNKFIDKFSCIVHWLAFKKKNLYLNLFVLRMTTDGANNFQKSQIIKFFITVHIFNTIQSWHHLIIYLSHMTHHYHIHIHNEYALAWIQGLDMQTDLLTVTIDLMMVMVVDWISVFNKKVMVKIEWIYFLTPPSSFLYWKIIVLIIMQRLIVVGVDVVKFKKKFNCDIDMACFFSVQNWLLHGLTDIIIKIYYNHLLNKFFSIKSFFFVHACQTT